MKADREIKVRCSACGHLTRIPTVTNADRIRAMTDEELAKLLNKPIGDACRKDCDIENDRCEDCVLEWLKERVDG